MRIPLAREGYPFIAVAAVPALAALLAALYSGSTLLWGISLLLLLLAVCMAAFFRDPERPGPRGPDLVVAPADGKVIEIKQVEEPDFVRGRSLRISIFLSLLDVHVNRYPVSGAVGLRSYGPGGFGPAWRSSASHSNERSTTGIAADYGPVLVRQIAGLAARRIVTYARLGEQVRQGERMGLIRFGSRVDVFMPPRARPSVREGDRAVGGVTVLARLGDAGADEQEVER